MSIILYIFTERREGEDMYSNIIHIGIRTVISTIGKFEIMNALKDADGSYSVRKFGGYLSLIVLAYLIVSFTITNPGKEVPTAYLVSIDVIIGFYFVKRGLESVTLSNNKSEKV